MHNPILWPKLGLSGWICPYRTVPDDPTKTGQTFRKTAYRFGQWLSVGALLLLPKCSLCLFALGSAITLCGLPTPTTPLWEYGLMGSLSLAPLTLLACGCAKHRKSMAGLWLILGALSILLFLILDTHRTLYYLGTALLSIGILWQNLRNRYVGLTTRAKGEPPCHPSSITHTKQSE